jgi:hypothetical protein
MKSRDGKFVGPVGTDQVDDYHRSRENQPWYSEWKKTTDRVIAALMARDSTKQGTPEREAADREYEAAIAAFRLLAEQHR